MPYPLSMLLNQSKPILVFGSGGQVGRALKLYLDDLRVPAIFLKRSDCDLSDELSILKILDRYRPKIIVNAAAYTAVDQADSECQLAFSINARAPAVMAEYIANLVNGIFVHYSTDYVFADLKNTPYFEDDIAGPFENLGAYGQSKLAGEKVIKESFKNSENYSHNFCNDTASRYFILRTSWVYGDGDNFIRKILRLANEREQLRVVADQVGVATSAQWLAQVGIQVAASRFKSGIYHAVPDGEISWYDLALFTVEIANKYKKITKLNSKNIVPIRGMDYCSPSPRPYNSRLNNLKLKKALSEISFVEDYPHWEEQVEAYIKDYIKCSSKN